MHLKHLNLSQSADHDLAMRVILSAPAYCLDCFASLPTEELARGVLRARPHGVPAEHVQWLAALDHDQPIGLIQIATHVPSPDTAAILMLVMDSSRQRKHLGCEVVDRLSRQARQWPGIRRWYLSVLANNEVALKFWHHCGFEACAADIPLAGYAHAAHGFQRAIKGKPVCRGGRSPCHDVHLSHAQHLMTLRR